MPLTRPTRGWTRRALIRDGAAIAGLGVLARYMPEARTSVRAQTAAGAPAATRTGSTLVLLGTQGGPSINLGFDMADRSIVFSGDTAYSPALVELARNADLFVCETIEMALYQRLLQQAEQEEAKTGNINSIPRHIVETHSTTEDVGRMAAAARVTTVVLSHLLPGSNPARGGELDDAAYIDGVRKHFDGEVIVGRDQMRL
jgi:ribonuclease BN (tRNA processing enzyme)